MSVSARYGDCWNARCGIKRDSDPADRLRKLEAEVEQRAFDPAAVVPLLAPVLGIGPESGYEPVRAEGAKLYRQIAGAIHDYLLACLGSGPALVLVDDMHWFDEDTVEVVQTLLREDSGRLMVVITGRKLPPLPDTTQVFEVRPLSDADADKLVLRAAPGHGTGGAQAVHKRCDGIPLYIEEVVAKLKEQPSMPAKPRKCPTPSTNRFSRGCGPRTNTLPLSRRPR